VTAHFWQDQTTFGLSRTVLTAKFSFSTVKTLLAPPKALWKSQNTAGTVPTLFAPLFPAPQRPNAVNTGTLHFPMS
jgi:hypothetical protein